MTPAVAAGGVAGATLRWALTEIAAPTATEWPWATLAANVLGCLLIGWFSAALAQTEAAGRSNDVGESAAAVLLTAATVGFCGGLTTFSGLAVQAVQLAEADRVGTAALYLLLTVATGVAAVVVGRSAYMRRVESRRGAGL